MKSRPGKCSAVGTASPIACFSISEIFPFFFTKKKIVKVSAGCNGQPPALKEME